MTATAIIRTYFAIAGAFTLSASLIWGINTLFLLDAGLNIAEVFIANAFFTLGTVLFEIPTGVIADTLGRRVSFLLSLIVLIISTLAYVAGSLLPLGLAWFCLASVLLGLGFTFYTGAVEAWLVDALNSSGYEGPLDAVFARGAQFTGSTMLAGTILGGLLGSLHLALPYLVRAGLLALAFVVAWRMMHDIGYTPRPLELRRIPAALQQLTRDSLQFGWREPRLRLLLLSALLLQGFMMWGFYAWQPYFLQLFGDPAAVWLSGVITACISLAGIAGNSVVTWYTRRGGRRTGLMIPAAALFALCMVGIGLAGSLLPAVALLLLGMGALGALQPVRQSYMHQIIPAENRAALVSVDSMAGSLGGIVQQMVLGNVALRLSVPVGYIVGGSLSLLALPLLLRLRRRGTPADQIAPEAAPA
ncbi:MAG: MFS transporter [Anaerolineae bacterium]|nr:MFS transporter [Anaerolineae bacterium]